MRINNLAFLLCASVVFGGALQAATVYNYAFGGLTPNDLGTTHTFSPTSGPSPTITASGFQPGPGTTVVAVDLYSKGSSGFPPPNDESGLGLTNDPSHDHEITPGSFIMLDLGNLQLTSLGIYMESTTDGEKWDIWGSNTPAVSGHSYTIPNGITGTSEGLQNLSSLEGDRYIFISSLCGNVLVGALTDTVVTTNPEPASAGLAGLALLGFGVLFRRRFGKNVQQA